MDRNEFMELVYETFADETDNVLANGIIEAADAYAEHEKAEVQTELMMLPSLPTEPQWIPIAERLPKDGTWNIFTDGKNISVERYKADAIDHFFPPGRWFGLDDAVAWIPLPAPYVEVVGDDES